MANDVVCYSTRLSIHEPDPFNGLQTPTNLLGDRTIRTAVFEAIGKWTLTGTHMTAYETFWKEKVKSGQVDWGDLRIRKFTEQRDEIDKYLQLRIDVHSLEVRVHILHIFIALLPLTDL